MIHIGEKIKEVIDTKGISVTQFAKQINKSRSVVYNIFERESLDTHLLYKIGSVLEFNFFNLFEKLLDENNTIIISQPTTPNWKNKHHHLLAKYNCLLESKIEDYFSVKKRS